MVTGAPPTGVGWPGLAFNTSLASYTSSVGESFGWPEWNASAIALFGPDSRTTKGARDDHVEIVGSASASRGGGCGCSQKPLAAVPSTHSH